MKLIGLCGYARVGKDTAASGMPGFKRLAFADALKKDVEPLLAKVGCSLTNPEDKEKARDLLVAWGAVARKFIPEFWINRLIGQIDGEDGRVVITDVRYANEVQTITRFGGKVIRIHRTGFGPANDEEARSFREIDALFDLPEVINDFTREELARRVLVLAGVNERKNTSPKRTQKDFTRKDLQELAAKHGRKSVDET